MIRNHDANATGMTLNEMINQVYSDKKHMFGLGGGGLFSGGGGVRILILSRLITIPRHRDVLVHHRLLQQPQRLRVWRHFAPASDFTRDGAKAHVICL